MLNPFAVIGAALALGAAAVSVPGSPVLRELQVVAPERQNVQTRQEPRERHPEIRKAIDQLQKAKYDLQHAAHDFGGHRVAAIAACDNAIAQLRLALQYDKR